MQVACFGQHCFYHNHFPFTVVLATILAIIQIALTWQVVKTRKKYKQSIGAIKKEEYERKNGALSNFNSFLPITLILYALAENNRVNCGILFFLGGFYVLARVVHVYSLYAYETKHKKFNLRIFGMMGTFAVILALAASNLYKTFSHFPY